VAHSLAYGHGFHTPIGSHLGSAEGFTRLWIQSVHVTMTASAAGGYCFAVIIDCLVEHYFLALLRVSADFGSPTREHTNLARSSRAQCHRTQCQPSAFLEELKMGFLDEVISAALGAKAQSAQGPV